MSDPKGQDRNARIGLSGSSSGRLDAKKGSEQGMVRQSFSHGRSKSVAVEVKRRRTARPSAGSGGAAGGEGDTATKARADSPAQQGGQSTGEGRGQQQRRPMVLKPLTDDEKSARLKALSQARRNEEEARKRAEENARRAAEEAARRKAEEEEAARRKAEEEERRKVEEEARRKAEEQAARLLAEEAGERDAGTAEKAAEARGEAAKGEEARQAGTSPGEAAAGEAPASAEAPATARPATPSEAPARRSGKAGARAPKKADAEDDTDRRGKGRGKPEKRGGSRRTDERESRQSGRPVAPPPAEEEDEDEERQRVRSLTAARRQRERDRRQAAGEEEPQGREVVIPDSITVQDLAARMAVRGAEVVKALMRNGVMVTINQTIDADTAELVVAEFGQQAKRVSEADVEEGIEGGEDRPEELRPRSPVVTVMGHVDHGKTSLLDALRNADVAAGEAGGITQHIGAYQVDIGHGLPVTFIDTPGHAAFTAMRARGAEATDIVVLVVAADDGVMPQTIEAISHAKAAGVPLIVAVNKIDRPDANPDHVKQELLQHDVVAEDFGGEVQCVPVSAIKRENLDKLIEAIQLQAEILELKANPDREAQGVIIEGRLDRGRGAVATVLIKNGTLKQGDVVIAGMHCGRVRAMVDDRGRTVETAGPATPVEILGLDGVPDAGDKLFIVEHERRAREIADYRQRKRREHATIGGVAPRGSLEDMFSQLRSGDLKELPVVIKADVHGSLEAISAGLEKLGTDEVTVRILHGGVGAITESDVTLAQASNAAIIGFNVRANAQARELAKREGVEIRYYGIIYELLDDVKALLSGMLAPEAREVVIGRAEIREVFNITRIGKVAGCRVVDGFLRRDARARLLRDDVVVFEGQLGSLKRFKDDVREVREGFECGTSIEGYNDIRVGDVIEAYEVQEVARSL